MVDIGESLKVLTANDLHAKAERLKIQELTNNLFKIEISHALTSSHHIERILTTFEDNNASNH